MTNPINSPVPMKMVPAWLLLALREVGTHEIAGTHANPRIGEYLRSTTISHTLAESDETPWCSAFVNWCMVQTGMAGTNSAAARSWLSWGMRQKVPTVGCLAVLTAPERGPTAGHVAFYVHHDQQHVWLYGGNQGNTVGIVAYPIARLIEYRWPAPLQHLVP